MHTHMYTKGLVTIQFYSGEPASPMPSETVSFLYWSIHWVYPRKIRNRNSYLDICHVMWTPSRFWTPSCVWGMSHMTRRWSVKFNEYESSSLPAQETAHEEVLSSPRGWERCPRSGTSTVGDGAQCPVSAEALAGTSVLGSGHWASLRSLLSLTSGPCWGLCELIHANSMPASWHQR